MNVYHGFKQITVDFNRKKAFEALVFGFDTGNAFDKLLSNEKKVRQGASFQKLWSSHLALGYLSTRRDFPRFDWISKQE
jgi:hypothetical protein